MAAPLSSVHALPSVYAAEEARTEGGDPKAMYACLGRRAAVARVPGLTTFNVDGALQPFQAGAISTQSGTNVSTANIATVPAGHRLVIEFVTATGQVPPTQHVEILQITTSTDPFGGLTHDLLVNAQPAAVIGDSLFRASQTVKLYANPGTTVQALFRRSASTGNATFDMTISGYLVPVL